MGCSDKSKNIVMVLLSICVILPLFTVMIPLMESGGDSLVSSGVPLAGLFSTGGLMFILIMVGLLLFVINKYVYTY